MQRLFLLLFALLIVSCGPQTEVTQTGNEPFFDLAGYIDGQVDSLQQAGLAVTKTIVLNGTEESKTLTELDYAADLRMFREADINKPAWIDKYAVDSVAQADGSLITYTATDSSMQTRRLVVERREGKPVSIEVHRQTGTVLSDGDHLLRYRPASGYLIRTEQINRFGKDLDAKITVDWAKK